MRMPMLMSEIEFQDGLQGFLTDGCLAFIYYSSGEMTVQKKASLMETVVQGFEKSTVLLIE